jgi:hypothetical protein
MRRCGWRDQTRTWHWPQDKSLGKMMNQIVKFLTIPESATTAYFFGTHGAIKNKQIKHKQKWSPELVDENGKIKLMFTFNQPNKTTIKRC